VAAGVPANDRCHDKLYNLVENRYVFQGEAPNYD
jgi:hypothetical protein